MKLKGERNYFFAVPLQKVDSEKHGVHFPETYGFCCLYYPSSYQDDQDFLYLIKVFDYFDDTPEVNIKSLSAKKLLFGESLFIPYIPTRGQLKWILIGEQIQFRELADFPNLKLSSPQTTIHPNQRNWFLIENAGFNDQAWNKNKRTYTEVKHLESGENMSEVSVKLRMYISMLKSEFQKRGIKVELVEWKELLFNIIINEPATKKSSPESIKNDFLEGFIYDYLDIWE